MDHIKAEKRAYIVLSVAQFALGAYLIARPEQSFSIACYAIGTVLVVYGIIKLIGYFTKDMYQLAFQFDFAMGILSAIVGCLLLFHWEHILRAFPTFVGILILIDGVFKIQVRFWWYMESLN